MLIWARMWGWRCRLSDEGMCSRGACRSMGKGRQFHVWPNFAPQIGVSKTHLSECFLGVMRTVLDGACATAHINLAHTSTHARTHMLGTDMTLLMMLHTLHSMMVPGGRGAAIHLLKTRLICLNFMKKRPRYRAFLSSDYNAVRRQVLQRRTWDLLQY